MARTTLPMLCFAKGSLVYSLAATWPASGSRDIYIGTLRIVGAAPRLGRKAQRLVVTLANGQRVKAYRLGPHHAICAAV